MTLNNQVKDFQGSYTEYLGNKCLYYLYNLLHVNKPKSTVKTSPRCEERLPVVIINHLLKVKLKLKIQKVTMRNLLNR